MSWLARLFGGRRDNRAGVSTGGSLDDQTRRQLASAGGDLAKPTDVVNYLYLPDEARAQQAGADLRAAGFTVEVRPAATGQNWLAKANRDMIPSSENIAQMRTLFENLAIKLGGDYDGWEAVVTR
jgi:hypothetical protein